ncbi:hypothetical protein SAMN05720470_104139 [Fibrobacter sp. UWOV1]|uniref:hypothetical protein n=1 Tax=Fibrobacter sp. UWOV1 TaxID=1896215 RepID=UPI00091225E0|nr:hypothetical protein [Fibrobacter sp. UWOV1]SHL05620.1 hypothetical protein SAMN05720470_104139 [Fibrobacter sp. UWOV1]
MTNEECGIIYIPSMRFLLLTIVFVAFAFAENPIKADSAIVSNTQKDSTLAKNAPKDTIVDTIYVVPDDGIPWNREHFDPERLVRHETFDPALKVAYTYSVSFMGGTFGSFAQQSYMAHLAYEFTPELHLYANVGLWMPLYSNFRFGTPIAKEDVRQGNVDVVLPDIALEYKPNDNMSFRLMFVNERDAFKAYGPHRYLYGGCPWRNPYYCR